MIEYLKKIKERDPAAKNIIEIFFFYPGFHCFSIYKLSHKLWSLRLFFLARLLSYISRMFTGIEIHPAAKIGKYFFIDHGHGVVIGETSIIGNNVLIYHGVTLGGTSLQKGKRHPTIGNDVIIGAGAKILGPIKIGNNARIGANAVVTKDVKKDTTVMGIPAKEIDKIHKKINVDFTAYGTPIDLDEISLDSDLLKSLEQKIKILEREVNQLKNKKKV